MSLFSELKRRNVIRVAAAYVVAAWLLIQVAETIFPLFGFDETPARLVVIVLAIGFVPAVVFAWAFELTPEGLKREKDVDRSKSIASRTGKKLDRAIMLVLALALGYFAFDKFVLSESREASLVEQAREQGRSEAFAQAYGDRSIVVLAFDDMSPEGDQEYLSDGIAEELLNRLTKIPGLRVISRSSAFSYKGKDVKLAQVADELNVAHILEGSVRKAGNRVRITAQLIEARSDSHLWSETYDRTLDDIFAIQDEIAATVVAQLKLTLLGEAPSMNEVDPEAYALFLQARHLAYRNSADSWDKAIALYRQALEIEPSFPAALSGLAQSIRDRTGRIAGQVQMDEGFRVAKELVTQALRIDPEHANAHAVLGDIARSNGDLEAAAAHFEKALSLAPTDPGILLESADLLNFLGRNREGVEILKYLVDRDPLNPRAHWRLGYAYETAGRWLDARAAFEKALLLSPDMGIARVAVGVTLLEQEYPDPEKALTSIKQDKNEAWRLVGLAMAYFKLGQHDASDAAVRALIAEHEAVASYNIAAIYAYRNERDSAFEWLEKAVRHRDPGLPEIVRQNFVFRNLHADARWMPFLERIGMSPAQLGAIDFEVTLPAR